MAHPWVLIQFIEIIGHSGDFDRGDDSYFLGKRHGPVHKLELLNGPLWIGLTVMLLSALCRAIGTIIAKPALDMGLDPFSGASWRVAISVLAYLALMVLVPTSWTRSRSWLLHAENDGPSRAQWHPGHADWHDAVHLGIEHRGRGNRRRGGQHGSLVQLPILGF